MKLVILVAATGVLSLLLNLLMIGLGPRLGLMDQPDGRRVHVKPVPRAGGIAIWISFMVGVGGWSWWTSLMNGAPLMAALEDVRAFAAASAILLVVGFFDDRGGIRSWVKLGWQVVAAVVYWALSFNGAGSIAGFEMAWWVDLGLWVAWIVLLINAFNLIDGLDSLCAGLVSVSLLGMIAIQIATGQAASVPVLALMLASLAGFLWFNRHPAKLFLGDAGSMMLGLFVASMVTELVGRRTAGAAILLPVAVAGVPLLDVLLAVWRRSVRKVLSRWSGGETIGVFDPDKDHLHHRLLAQGWSQRRVAAMLQVSALVISVIAFMPIMLGTRGWSVALIAGFVLGVFLLRHVASVEFVQSGTLVHFAVKRRGGKGFIRLVYACWDILMIPLAAMIALWIESNAMTRDDLPVEAATFIACHALVGVLGLNLMRVYRRLWSRARLREFVVVAMGLAVAGGANVLFFTASSWDVTWSLVRMGWMASSMATILVLLPRAATGLVREMAIDNLHRTRGPAPGRPFRTLVWGAGDLGNLFLDHLTQQPQRGLRCEVIGFIDDSPQLRNRTLRGFRIFGSTEELPSLCSKMRIGQVVVAIDGLPEARLQDLQRQLAARDVKLLEWHCRVRPSAAAREPAKPALKEAAR